MKFAKTLHDVMVPEWKTQYVDYKIGKKKIKATTNRLRNASTSPALNSLRRSATLVEAGRPLRGENASENIPNKVRKLSAVFRRPRGNTLNISPPPVLDPDAVAERSPLQPCLDLHKVDPLTSPTTYGSMGHSPTTLSGSGARRPSSFVLPDPMQPIHQQHELNTSQLDGANDEAIEDEQAPAPIQLARTDTAKAIEEGHPPFLRRVLTFGRQPATVGTELTLSLHEVQAKAEKEFLKWLLDELNKCEQFYAEREKEVVERYDEMYEQLDVMRDRWLRSKHNIPFEEDDAEESVNDSDTTPPSSVVIDNACESQKPRKRPAWKTVTEAMNGLTKTGGPRSEPEDEPHDFHHDHRDYERRRLARKPSNDPPHRVAKRKLKKAYIEFYHGLEMLKSYITINREAFRKITKKFDKASGLRTSHRFMTEYVDKSYFGGPNNKLDDLMNDTEGLFARFFERGNRKEASQRLRSRENKTLHHASMLRSGLSLGAAVIIAAYAVYTCVTRLYDETNPDLALKTGYLLQIWGGVALILAQALLFSINLRVWAKNKINYAFIFEFDARHTLNYRQFLEIPALLSLLFAVCFWFSAHSSDIWDGAPDMIHFPIIFVVLAGLFLLNPFQVCYYHSRRWFLRVLFRLFFSGLFPVEFKDFWMGDIFCSMTYALGNVELFFCLYARDWKEPAMCNSSHSRLMGFFTALPGIWRLLQCLRRYHDSKMWFPHMANGGKYAFTVLHYMTLSIWRIDTHHAAKAAFIFCATINSIYTTVWDIVMDWSLLDPYAKYPFLRQNLGFKSPWPYYFAMVIDPLIRCDWFLYFIFANRIQHSALLSFVLSLIEVLRRFMWCFFRMENEHNGNVGANRAYRVLPLPYHFPCTPPPISTVREEPEPETDYFASQPDRESSSTAREPDLERMDTLRRRPSRAVPSSPVIRTIARVGRTMTNAHLQDYERRKPKVDEDVEAEFSSDDEEDEGEDYYARTADSALGQRMKHRHARSKARRT